MNNTRHNTRQVKQVKRGEVYWINLGKQMGSVQGGNRLCVIIQNDTGNRYAPTTIIAPLTTAKKKSKQPTHVELETKLPNVSQVLLEQVQTVPKEMLGQYQTTVTENDLRKINRAIAVSMGVR